MQVEERGPKRPLHGVLWLLLVISLAFGVWVVGFFMDPAIRIGAYIFFALLIVMSLIKSHSAFTGVKRVGKPS